MKEADLTCLTFCSTLCVMKYELVDSEELMVDGGKGARDQVRGVRWLGAGRPSFAAAAMKGRQSKLVKPNQTKNGVEGWEPGCLDKDGARECRALP